MKKIIRLTILLSIIGFYGHNNYSHAQNPVSDWDMYQDSLRNEILARKENEILKKSFLQEMYIRDVVKVCGDSITIHIPFDLHSPYDCGASDCYSTDVSFSLKLGKTLVFPQKMQFTEHEHGCVEQETQISGVFYLTGQSNNHVIYHSPKYGRTLVLFRKHESVRTCAYYFTNITKDSITNSNVYKIEEEHIEDGPADQIFPFKSRILSIVDYEIHINTLSLHTSKPW